MVTEQKLLQLVNECFPELVDSNIPQINSKHDEILLISEAAEELKNLDFFQKQVNYELERKHLVNPGAYVFNASTVPLINKEPVIKALEELKSSAYGKVVTVETESGERTKYRIAQANYSIINVTYDPEIDEKINVINRLCPVAKELVSAEVGDERTLPQVGLVFVTAVDLLDRYSRGELDNFSRLQFWSDRLSTNTDKSEDEFDPLIIENLKKRVNRWPTDCFKTEEEKEEQDDILISFTEESNSSLGSSFYTRTTKVQEELLNRPRRGVVIVEGIAGSGKTSVALGRIKALHDAQVENDKEEVVDDFFSDETNMVGFVLQKQLITYLKQTTIELNLSKMQVKEFRELQSTLLRKRSLVLQLKAPLNPSGVFVRISHSGLEFESTMPWLHAIDKLIANHYLKEVQGNFGKLEDSWLNNQLSSNKIKKIDYAKLVGVAWGIAKKDFDKLVISNERKNKKGFYSEGMVNRLKKVYVKFSKLVDEGARWYFYDNTWHKKSLEDEVSIPLYPFETQHIQSPEQAKWLKQFRQGIRTKLRKTLLLDNAKSSMPTLTTWYMEILNDHGQDLLSEFGDGVSKIKERLNGKKLSDSDLNLLLAITHIMSTGNKYSEDDQTRLASYLSEPSYYSTVFIDEVQDFTEIQVYLMSAQADPDRRAVTVVGDFKQQLTPNSVCDLARCFPNASESEIKPAKLVENKRQTKNLSNYSAQFREKIGEKSISVITAPVFQEGELTSTEGDEDILQKKVLEIIIGTPANKSITVICPNNEYAKTLWENLHDEIHNNYRESHYLEDNRDLNKPLYINFTDAKSTKGLEFDVVIAPYFNKYNLNDKLEANSAYVTVSRPKEQLHLIELKE